MLVTCSSLGKHNWTGVRAASKHCTSPFSLKARKTAPSGWQTRLEAVKLAFTWLSTRFSTLEERCQAVQEDYDAHLVKGEDGAINCTKEHTVGERDKSVTDHQVGNDHRPRDSSSQVLPVLQGKDGVLQLGFT